MKWSGKGLYNYKIITFDTFKEVALLHFYRSTKNEDMRVSIQNANAFEKYFERESAISITNMNAIAQRTN